MANQSFPLLLRSDSNSELFATPLHPQLKPAKKDIDLDKKLQTAIVYRADNSSFTLNLVNIDDNTVFANLIDSNNAEAGKCDFSTSLNSARLISSEDKDRLKRYFLEKKARSQSDPLVSQIQLLSERRDELQKILSSSDSDSNPIISKIAQEQLLGIELEEKIADLLVQLKKQQSQLEISTSVVDTARLISIERSLAQRELRWLKSQLKTLPDPLSPREQQQFDHAQKVYELKKAISEAKSKLARGESNTGQHLDQAIEG